MGNLSKPSTKQRPQYVSRIDLLPDEIVEKIYLEKQRLEHNEVCKQIEKSGTTNDHLCTRDDISKWKHLWATTPYRLVQNLKAHNIGKSTLLIAEQVMETMS